MKNLSENPYFDSEIDLDTNFEKYKLINYRVYEKKIGDIYRTLQKNNLEIILIKGWAAAENYPKPYLRQIGDVDLAVNPLKFIKAVALTKDLGNGEIDLHCGLRHLDTLDWNDLFENSYSKNCGEVRLNILRPEDHLRVLCVHWLTDGGANKERLWDIYYSVQNRPPGFDWNRCLNVVSETRRKWIVCTIGLAQKYLELDLRDTPLADEKIYIPQWVIKTVEREWRSVVKLRAIPFNLKNKRELWRQIKKRIPPNPIQATIDMEGEFDDKSRLKYQMGDILYRLKPSLKRLSKSLFDKNK